MVDISHITVSCQARLGGCTLPAEEYPNLQVGDIIVLDEQATEPVAVCVAGVRLYSALPGLVGMYKAVVIK